MAGTFNESVEIEIPCQECGHKFKRSIREIKREPHFSCPKCGLDFDASKFVAGLDDAEKAITKFKRDLKKKFPKK